MPSEPSRQSRYPLVIEDALACTLAIGFKYLWVDRYCIDQENPETKHATIQRMDQIYSNASITIINAAGDGPECGLPGVSVVPRHSQSAVTINGVLFTGLPNANKDIWTSQWSTRGCKWIRMKWMGTTADPAFLSPGTYQEGLLACRRLVITQSQVYYQCLKTWACEALQGSLSLNRSSWLSGDSFQVELDIRTAMQAFPVNLIAAYDIEQRIGEYLRRNLTFQSDILNAFMGILREAWLLERLVYHFWGLPFLSETSKRRSLDQSFLDALQWSVSERSMSSDLTRRPSFPSWTWAGWQGLRRINVGLINPTSDKCDGSVLFEDLFGNRVSIEKYVEKMQTSWNMYEFQPHVYLFGWVATVQICSRGRYNRSNVAVADGQGQAFTRTDLVEASPPIAVDPTIPDWITKTKFVAFLYPSDVSQDTIRARGLLLRATEDHGYERSGRLRNVYGCWTNRNEDFAWLEIKDMSGTAPIAKLQCRRSTIKLV